MSKKETEFDRYDRMKRLERESEVQRRKSEDFLNDSEDDSKRGGKLRPTGSQRKTGQKQRAPKDFDKSHDSNFDDEYV